MSGIESRNIFDSMGDRMVRLRLDEKHVSNVGDIRYD